MTRRPRITLVLGLALLSSALITPATAAQSFVDGEVRGAPQFLRYRLDAPAATTISQFAFPVFVLIPAGDRFTFDIGTSYARTRVTSGTRTSEISGLTDTQVRGNLTLGSDFVVLTAGLNLPTGTSSVTLDQFEAAGLIGNDFLAFPISNMGTGFAITGGVALARPIGQWNVGLGGAVRRSASFEPFDIPDQSLRFQPGTEYRVRLGVDRTVGAGRAALGLTYSAFGKDDAGGSVYSTGDRLIAQGAYTAALAERAVTVAAYNVHRGRGSYASGEPAGRENIANVFASVALNPGGALLEPSIEVRHRLQDVPTTSSAAGMAPADASRSSVLGTVGLRTRVTLGSARLYPAVGYTRGSLESDDTSGAPTRTRLTGFRAQVALRIGQ